jgi:hypothetical protein
MKEEEDSTRIRFHSFTVVAGMFNPAGENVKVEHRTTVAPKFNQAWMILCFPGFDLSLKGFCFFPLTALRKSCECKQQMSRNYYDRIACVYSSHNFQKLTKLLLRSTKKLKTAAMLQ